MADRKRGTNKKPRRRLLLIAGIIGAILIYGLAVERTGVSLDEITSESRQTSLFRIIRSLARPELVTYDTAEVITEVDLFIPCVGEPAPATGPQLGVTPGCGEPGDVVTVVGSGFEPVTLGRLQFIPDSEFEVTLPLTSFETDRDGRFEAEITLPERPSDNPQQLRALVSERLGTWADREEVWTDLNENGVVDLGIIENGQFTTSVQGVSTDTPAVALLDATRQVTEFLTTGEAFVAAEGPANGLEALPIGEGSGDISIQSIEPSPDGVSVTIFGPDDTDISAYRVAVYDGASGEELGTAVLGDLIEMSPRVSETAWLTLEKIIDTVFLALVATTAGLIVALPLSFIAARNLMRDVSTTVIGLGFALIAIPVGFWLGMQYVRFQRSVLDGTVDNVAIQLALFVIGGLAVFLLIRQILFGPEVVSTPVRALRGIGMVVAGAAFLEGTFGLLTAFGEALHDPFGPLGFVPGLFSTLGELGTVALPIIIGLGAIVIPVGLTNRAAHWLRSHLAEGPRAVVQFSSMALGGAVAAAILGGLIDWVYQITDPVKTLWIPAAVGAVVGLVLAEVGRRSGEVKIGLSIYYVARTIFNTLRSIEPLVMVIVFVVWVGFGEFAGSIALAIHTAAALAKLYSEQVESISSGPLEAVRATGATRMQQTIYAVVPQIVPPYIAFTMYRWDINVRLSTILGFAGGGGVGFLLQQNVQLGLYRAASVQMLAIVIVVASMDYTSSRLRERFT